MKKKLYYLVLLSCFILLFIFFYFKFSNPNIVNTTTADTVSNLIGDTNYNLLEDTNILIEDTTNNLIKDATNNLMGNTTLNTESNPPQNSISDTNTLYNSDPQLIIDTSIQVPTKESLRILPSGTIINIDNLGDHMDEICFYYEEIAEEVLNRIKGKSYGEDCTIPLEDLRYVRVLYYGFDKKTHIGELIVNAAIADDIVEIFLELYEIKYPIEQMALVDDYNADDNASMAANNTSSFNYRTTPGSTHLSKHALGLAIDINPLYNPYVKYSDLGTIVLPIEGMEYADRSLECSYYIKEHDPCYDAFIKRGFTWGGFWKNSPDYQHFQKLLN